MTDIYTKFIETMRKWSDAFVGSSTQDNRNLAYERDICDRAQIYKMPKSQLDALLVSADGYKYCDDPLRLRELRKYIQGRKRR